MRPSRATLVCRTSPTSQHHPVANVREHSVLHRHLASHDHVRNAFRQLVRVLQGAALAKPHRVEYYHVGRCALLDAAAFSQA